MIDKNYLDRLKQEDYIAWDDLVNDPMVVGSDNGGDFIPVVIVIIIFIAVALSVFW